MLGAIAIVLVIALGAGLYYHGHQQALAQQAENNELSDQLTALHNEQAQEKLRINALINQQNKALSVADQLQTSQSQQLKELEAKVAAISGSDAKTGYSLRLIFWLSWPVASYGAIRTSQPPVRC